MSFVTVPVEIAEGRIIVSEPEILPRNGSALLTILRRDESEGGLSRLSDSELLAAQTWEKLGPAPEIDYDKL